MPGGNAFGEGFFKMFNGIKLLEVSQRGSNRQRAGAGLSNCVTLCAIRLYDCFTAPHCSHRLRFGGADEEQNGNGNWDRTKCLHMFLPLDDMSGETLNQSVWGMRQPGGYFDETLIFRLGSFGSDFGMVTCRTPLSNSAVIFSTSTVSGKVIVRAKLP